MQGNSKIKTVFKTYATLIFVLMTQFLQAQTDFRAGYVIDAKNDTLIGDIDYRGDISMGESCTFKPNNTKKVVEYAPKDIVGYRFKDDRCFVSKVINGKTVFLEFLIKGKVNIYYLRNRDHDYYFIEKESQQLVELPYKQVLDYTESRLLVNQSKKYIGILMYYMQDAPRFRDRITKMQQPNHETLIELAKDYHNAVCKDESCIIYKRKIPVVSVNLELVGGFTNYYNLDYIIDKNYPTVGVLAHFWLPRTNEKLYFRTGVVYSRVRIDNNVGSVYKIPLQVEYVYPKGRIKPRFAYGINVYGSIATDVGVMAGLTTTLTKKININFNYDANFTPNEYLFVIPANFFAYTFSVGLSMKL